VAYAPSTGLQAPSLQQYGLPPTTGVSYDPRLAYGLPPTTSPVQTAQMPPQGYFGGRYS
jgi:hypothetical protein